MGTKLFIGNLSYHTTEGSLRTFFEGGGFQVASVKIVLDRETGKSRGFGFVEMNTEEDARNAIENLNGGELDGRSLRVSEAHETGGRGGGGGGGRGGRGGGGGGGGGYGGRRSY